VSDLTTGIPIVDWVLAALDTFGYLIVFGATVFENLFVVGSLTPGETVVIAASFVASRGRLMLSLVWLSSLLGTLVGSNISYWFGRLSGRAALVGLASKYETSRIGRLFRISDESVRASEEYFFQHGSKTVFMARFAIGLKNFVPVIAGASHMGVFWFELYTLLGGIVYTTAMCAIGWFLGENIDLAMRVATSIGWVGLGLVIAVVLAVWLARRRYEARRAREEIEEERREAQESVAITRALSTTRWSRIEVFDRVASTMSEAKRLAETEERGGLVVIAREQSEGRGRLGRTWMSPQGGLYVSVVLRPPPAAQQIATLSPVVALGVARGLERLGARPRLKWPNDVLLGEGKVAGVLAEASTSGKGESRWVIVGIGINIARAGRVHEGAAFLEESGISASIDDVAVAILDALAEDLDAFDSAGFSAVREEYRGRLATLGSDVRVSDADGRVLAEGVAEDVGDDGSLLVRDAQGAVHRVSAGEVTLRS
jgi:BirA family biotin operon repressor/biotin-[acetyl-CoA-carboxylase] ligase